MILSCLAKDPAQRPQTAAELSRRLADVEGAERWSTATARIWWDSAPARRALDRRRKGHDRAACGIPSPSSSTRSPRPARPPQTRRRARSGLARFASAALTSPSAPGYRRWCPGAPPKTGWSRPRSSRGTSGSPAASPGRWWSRPPASATSPADRCSGSATTGSSPASPSWSRTVRRSSDGQDPALHPDHRLPPDPPAPGAGAVFRRVPRAHRSAPRASAGHRQRDQGGAGAAAGRGVAAVPERAGAGEPAVR